METFDEVFLKQEKLISILWGVIAGLVAIHLTLQAVHYFVQELPWLLREIFDVDEEMDQTRNAELEQLMN